MRTLLLFTAAASAALGASAQPSRLSILPENPLLFGQGATQRVAVIAHFGGGLTRDVTVEANFLSEKPAVASVAAGIIHAAGNGGTRIRARYAGLEASTVALVQQASQPRTFSFAGDILPILTKYGCNGASCHGSLNGQGGFKLSLFGYDPAPDWEMIVNKHDGRRINRQQPEDSLLLRKPTFQVKHGGGKLIKEGSDDYLALLDWIRSGAPGGENAGRRMVSLRIWPNDGLLYGKGAQTRLLVTARFSDGSEADVSHLVRYSSNDDSIAAVTASGVVTAARGGETAIMVRAPGVVAAAKVGVVTSEREVAPLEQFNFIDEHVGAKLRRLRIPASARASDAEFLRRVYVDIIGLIPTAQEARRFLSDTRPDKRARLVDELLNRPEYADHWATYWGDHLSNTRQLLYNKGPYTFTRWLYNAFRKNLPYDQFVRQLIVSSGNMYEAAATSYYPLMRKEQDLAASTAQLFLGVSIECARCHNHPLEKWTQEDYNGMAAFFSQVRYKGAGPRNNERVLYLDFTRQFQHPDTKAVHRPKPLGDAPIPDPAGPETEFIDRREQLVDWMTRPNNPFFARAIVNRMWRNFLGRGLVEPVDDFRVTNPSTNDALLDALARDFVDHGYDLHHLIRRITASRTYQTSSMPVAGNQEDTMAYSRYYPKRLSAEQLADSIALATGIPDRYTSLYPGTRAMHLPEPEIESYFLEVFDRPSRQLICERKNAPTLNQALHLISGESLQQKISQPGSMLQQALGSGRSPAEIVEDLYLGTLSRFPEASERQLAEEAMRRAGSPQKGLEDLFWALLSSKEFLYNH
jgi:hypothetical protein